jgi:hypothetical protein
MPGYSRTTSQCLSRLGLRPADLEQFVGLELSEAEPLARSLGLTIFEAVVDGQPRHRVWVLMCTWLSVEARHGRIQRVVGLG